MGWGTYVSVKTSASARVMMLAVRGMPCILYGSRPRRRGGRKRPKSCTRVLFVYVYESVYVGVGG